MIYVIGLGMSPADLTAVHLDLIDRAQVLVGGRRHLDYFKNSRAQKIQITGALSALVTELGHRALEGEDIVVLASGDPLFHGIGSLISRQLPREQVAIYPNVTSVGAAFARIGESWQDARIISLHGHDLSPGHLELFRRAEKMALLTDPVHTPEWVGQTLSDHGIGDLRLCVLENLGASGDPGEKITWFEPGQEVEGPFSPLNMIILLRRKRPAPRVFLGMDETVFAHQRGLITKSEVRVVSLSRLELETHHTLWDLGAGSGSVSIEAAFFIRAGRIFAVEKEERRVGDILANKERFAVSNLTVVPGTLPGALENLPDPHRVFIGGGGRDLPELIKASAHRLAPGGIIVINTVLLGTMGESLSCLEDLDFDTDLVQVQVSRSHTMPHSTMLKAQNPVWVIRGRKPMQT